MIRVERGARLPVSVFWLRDQEAQPTQDELRLGSVPIEEAAGRQRLFLDIRLGNACPKKQSVDGHEKTLLGLTNNRSPQRVGRERRFAGSLSP